MKTLYKPLPAFAERNITLLLGEDQGMNTEASLAHAVQLLRSVKFGSIIYLNTVQTPRSMFEAARNQGLDPSDGSLMEIDNDPYKLIQIVTIPRGELHKKRKWIDFLLSENNVTHVIVNSWQFAGRNSRCREEAIFLLKELTCGLEKDSGSADPVSVIVYGEEQKNKTRSQRTDRIYGKLAALAKKVESISIHKEIESEHVATEREEMIEAYYGARIENAELKIVNEEGDSRTEFIPSWGKRTEVRSTEDENEDETEVASTTSIEGLRRTPYSLAKLPIHLNGYMTDRLPINSPKNSEVPKLQNVTSDIIKK